MILYVETSFLLDIGLKQESHSAANAIMVLAQDARIELVVPLYSILEAVHTGHGYRNRRSEVGKKLSDEFKQLRRSAPEPRVVDAFDTVIGQLTVSSGEVLFQLQTVVLEVLKRARLIDFNRTILEEAIAYQKSLRLSVPDSIICASVIADLRTLGSRDKQRCFLSGDRPFIEKVREQLKAWDCKVFESSEAALSFIRSVCD